MWRSSVPAHDLGSGLPPRFGGRPVARVANVLVPRARAARPRASVMMVVSGVHRVDAGVVWCDALVVGNVRPRTHG